MVIGEKKRWLETGKITIKFDIGNVNGLLIQAFVASANRCPDG